MTEDDRKVLLLHTVSKKVIEMTRELPGLDVLDFNLSKSSKRVTLSIGYKDSKPQKKLDLSEVLGFNSVGPGQNITNNQDFQPSMECKIHRQQCPFSKFPDKENLDTEKQKHRVPLYERPEFKEELHSPGLDMMQKEIVAIITDYRQKGSHNNKEYDSAEEDTPPTWFNTFVNTNVEQMDEAYFQSLLSQRAADPNNPAIQRRIDNFLTEHSRNNSGMSGDDFKEFIPGQTWLSREERRKQDLDTTLNGIETAISTHKKNACQIVSDILHQALAYENEGRILTAEIQKALKADKNEESRMTRNRRQQTQERRNRDSLKTQFATGDQVEDDCNNILEEAFNKIDRKVKEKKQVHFSQEEDDIKTEALQIGSYGSSMFRN